jgi:GNAT superfamily N-acetyltransferase
VTVRPARPGDEEALLEIQRASSIAALGHVFPPEQHEFPDDAVRASWSELLRRDGVTTLIGEVAGRPAGLVAWSAVWLHRLFVVPEQWGTGLAARLHDDAVRALARPCHLWVLEQNARARRFYERRGWCADGEHQPAGFPPWPTELRYTLDA